MSKEKNKNNSNNVVNFPQSRTKPKGAQANFKYLGLSKFAQKYEKDKPGLKGHWCSRCKGVWYGFVGECECPQCGNRNG